MDEVCRWDIAMKPVFLKIELRKDWAYIVNVEYPTVFGVDASTLVYSSISKYIYRETSIFSRIYDYILYGNQ